MGGKRLEMVQIKEVLRLRWERGLSVRETARALGLSVGVVSKTALRARDAGLTWTEADGLDEAALDERMYGRRGGKTGQFPEPDPAWLYQELKRPGVTLQTLHLEYLEEHPNGMQYTAFAGRLRAWKKRRKVVLRQEHKAGDALFVDFSGKKPHYIDRATGERIEAEFFVAVWGASSFTFADVVADQTIESWVATNTRALEYGGGVTRVTVPDNLKSAVVVA